MKAIAVVDKDWGIGCQGKLIYHLPSDLKRFKEITIGSVVIMGRATLESLPNGAPLSGRVNIILSSTLVRGDVIIAKNPIELFALIKGYNTDKVFLIGGESIFRQFIDECDTALITKVYSRELADKFMTNLDKDSDWIVEEESLLMEFEGVIYQYVLYKNAQKSHV